MIGVEALCRWTHPVRGEIPPSEFIPIAENSGLIIELGEWVLRRACLDGNAWPSVFIAVNVSPLQFRRADFVDVVERILAETGFDPTRLELEVTESTLLGNVDTAELAMFRLKALGVRLALDDFGTGYSSLLYLRRFPFDKLKIDRSFVHSIERAADAAAIVHAVVSLGRGLGMKVTAEGVETAEQQLFLRAAGIHSMQGYRFGRPGPAADISTRLAVTGLVPDRRRAVRPGDGGLTPRRGCSIQLQPDRPDDRRPLRDFLDQQLRRAFSGVESKSGVNPDALNIRCRSLSATRLARGLRDLFDDRFRRALRRIEADEILRRQAGKSCLRDRRNIGRGRKPRRARHREDAYLARVCAVRTLTALTLCTSIGMCPLIRSVIAGPAPR